VNGGETQDTRHKRTDRREELGFCLAFKGRLRGFDGLFTLPSMTPANGAPANPKAMIFWILWFAILSGLLMMQLLAKGGVPKLENPENASILFPAIGLGMAMASMTVRFVVIPRMDTLEKKLPLMLVGLAMAESIGVLGAFVVPPEEGASRLFMLVLAVVCIVVSAPVYVNSGKNKNPFVN
jgi:hypothetical protein